MPDPSPLPTYDDVVAAAGRLAGNAHRTPVVRSRRLDKLTGVQVFLKPENLQRMGAFKFRGAFNALSRLDDRQRRAGVVAFSSGNHAQAVALAGRLLGVPSTIVMPKDAPPSKLDATRSYGARIVLYDRYTEDREAISRELAGREGLTLIPPYDHADVIAGQGTAVRELIEEAGPLDALFVPLGGGGLLSGSCLAARAMLPECRIVGVEPEAGDDARQSLARGEIVHIDTPQTIADGAQTQHLGQLTFAIIRRDVQAIETASDEELKQTMRVIASTLKLVVEPTGCLGLAALRRLSRDYLGARVGVVLSGGNVDLGRYAQMLAG